MFCYISLLDLIQDFLILPLIFSAGAVLLASSTFQAGNYLCSTADLKDLSRANGGINFQPWIREYEASGFEPILCNGIISKNDRSFWKGCFVQRFFAPKSLINVPTTLALMQRVTCSAVAVACHTQNLLPKAHCSLREPKG